MLKECINSFLLLFFTVTALFYFLYKPFNIDSTLISHFNSRILLFNKTTPLILFYTKVFEKVYIAKDYDLTNCPYRCHISGNPLLYPKSDVAIFHSRDMKMDDFLQKHRNPNRLNVFSTMEALAHEKIRKKYFPKDFFNFTQTFRKDSNLWIPYDRFEKILPHEKNNKTLVWSDDQVEKALAKKTELAVIFVSHCITHSFREKLIEDMTRYANITTFGSCYNKTILNRSIELDKHFFYLAFENAVCKDYITEKFWRIKDLIVPVVLKRSILKGIAEDEYFIAADDFNSTQALVDRLSYLSKNMTEYKKYLGWTKVYKKTVSIEKTDFLCKLCETAVKKENHIIPDIYYWWETESKCHFNYLNFTLKYLKDNKITV